MNDMLMMYLKEHHRLLWELDDNMEEGTKSNDSLYRLVALEYGKHPNALLDLATTITEVINEQHEVELELDTAKAEESTQANVERHLSLLEISEIQNNRGIHIKDYL